MSNIGLATTPKCEAHFNATPLDEGLEIEDPENLPHKTTAPFDRVTVDMIDKALAETPPGLPMLANDLFSSRDTRWRLSRPVPSTDDPDAFVIAAPQSQYLVRPIRNLPYDALVLVGLMSNGAAARPALAGRMIAPDNRIFTIEPVDASTCQIKPSDASA